MLARFLEVKSAISKALIDIKEPILANVQFETLSAIETGLMPVRIGLEKLCSRKQLFTFIIGELNQQSSEFAKNMKCSLVQGISERCNVSLVGLMQYAAAVTVDLSHLLNKNSLIQLTEIIMTRLASGSILSSSPEEEDTNFLERNLNIVWKIRRTDPRRKRSSAVQLSLSSS
ncbi:hypothetical protein AVEN_254100-1 [Araneus ventricosus]|uniref:Uncharacterized protein n=1 Tax=Araneus ventricosus TaxID=182803 RepID=A0A4Y2BYR3_ARAVE|nr:hypothetical protein AVEN_254100-1 [Araneus ventricosus]